MSEQSLKVLGRDRFFEIFQKKPVFSSHNYFSKKKIRPKMQYYCNILVRAIQFLLFSVVRVEKRLRGLMGDEFTSLFISMMKHYKARDTLSLFPWKVICRYLGALSQLESAMPVTQDQLIPHCLHIPLARRKFLRTVTLWKRFAEMILPRTLLRF